jgi:hypothetical protein
MKSDLKVIKDLKRDKKATKKMTKLEYILQIKNFSYKQCIEDKITGL